MKHLGLRYQRRVEEKKRKAGLHVSSDLSPLRSPGIESGRAYTDEHYYYSKSMGSPSRLWWLQSGRVGLFCDLFRAVPGLVLEASEIRHTVSFMFTAHHHELVQRPCDRILPHDDDDVSMSISTAFSQDMILGSPPFQLSRTCNVHVS